MAENLASDQVTLAKVVDGGDIPEELVEKIETASTDAAEAKTDAAQAIEDAGDAAKTATNFITGGTESVQIHPEGDEENYTEITSEAFTIHKGGNIVASFGENAVFSMDGAQNSIGVNGMQLTDGKNIYYEVENASQGVVINRNVSWGDYVDDGQFEKITKISFSYIVYDRTDPRRFASYQVTTGEIDWTPSSGQQLTGNWKKGGAPFIHTGVADWVINDDTFSPNIDTESFVDPADIWSDKTSSFYYIEGISSRYKTQLTLAGNADLYGDAIVVKKENREKPLFQVDWNGNIHASQLWLSNLYATGINLNNHVLQYIGEFATVHGTSTTEFTLSTSEVNALKGHCTFGSIESGRCSANYDKVFELNVSTGVVTVKQSGTYTIHGHWYFTTGFTVNDIVHGRIRINGGAALGWDRSVSRVVNASFYKAEGVSMTVHLNAGDTIENVMMNQTAARGKYLPNGTISLIIAKIG